MEKKYFSIILVLLFATLSVFSLIHPGFPPTHDGEYHVIRFHQFYKMISEGNIYPRWAPDLNNGFGIPLFNYVYPFPNYVASFFHMFGLSFLDSFKLNMITATVIGGFFFYLWGSSFWGKTGGVVSSIFYLFSPYRFVDMYVRGSVGELWALAFFPGFLWSITMYIKEKKLLYFIFSCFLLSLIIFSHNILGVMFVSFSLLYILFFIIFIEKKDTIKKLLHTVLVFLVGLCISAIFWIPALLEKNLVVGLQIYDIEKNFPEIYQLLIPSWGTGFNTNDLSTLMSYQIGIANIFVIALSFLTFFLLFRKKDVEKAKIMIFFLSTFFLVFYLMLIQSLFIWHSLPLMNYFQFPWRFLSLEIVFASFLAGSIVYVFNKKGIAVLLVVISVLLSVPYTKIAYYHDRDDNYYISRSNFIDSTNSAGNVFNTLWMNRGIGKKKEVITSDSSIQIIKNKSTTLEFMSESKRKSSIVINKAYFPGWEAKVNGKHIPIDVTNDGTMKLALPSEKNLVKLHLALTQPQRVGTVISITSVCILFLVLFIKRKSLRLTF